MVDYFCAGNRELHALNFKQNFIFILFSCAGLTA